MTDKQLAKRMSKLREAFHVMCFTRNCEGCELLPIAKEFGCDSCADVWIWKKMKEEEEAQVRCNSSEKAVADAPNESPEAKEEAKLPKWCKVGAWVLMNNTLYKIVEVDSGHYNPLTVKDIHGGYSFAHPNIVCPVRFRPYTYGEAKGLLGQVMETEFNGTHGLHLISYVRDCAGHHVEINGSPHSWLSERLHATIGGVPIGVPEIDTEAMKGGEK
jgi:hypothetical protein